MIHSILKRINVEIQIYLDLISRKRYVTVQHHEQTYYNKVRFGWESCLQDPRKRHSNTNIESIASNPTQDCHVSVFCFGKAASPHDRWTFGKRNHLASDSLDWMESFYNLAFSKRRVNIDVKEQRLIQSVMQPTRQEFTPVAQLEPAIRSVVCHRQLCAG
jgi:hypothetical protein